MILSVQTLGEFRRAARALEKEEVKIINIWYRNPECDDTGKLPIISAFFHAYALTGHELSPALFSAERYNNEEDSCGPQPGRAF